MGPPRVAYPVGAQRELGAAPAGALRSHLVQPGVRACYGGVQSSADRILPAPPRPAACSRCSRRPAIDWVFMAVSACHARAAHRPTRPAPRRCSRASWRLSISHSRPPPQESRPQKDLIRKRQQQKAAKNDSEKKEPKMPRKSYATVVLGGVSDGHGGGLVTSRGCRRDALR